MDINLPGFIPVLLPVALSPGASFTLVLNSALTGGRRGLVATLTGTAVGIYTHALLIGLGLTAAIASTPALAAALRLAGTLYLLWLGVQLIRSGLKTVRNAASSRTADVTVKAAWLANVLNPKAVMFYLTVVSQFVGSHGGIASFLALASVHVAVMSLWLCAVSATLHYSARRADPLWLKKSVNLSGGLLLVMVAVHGLLS